jgi:hypothetical protein
MMVLKRWAENLGQGFLKLKKKINGSLILGKSSRKSTLCVLITRDCKFSLQEAIVVSRILGAFAPIIRSFYTTGYITPLTPLIPHCVQHIVSLHGKCDKDSAPKITSFYTTMKKMR